MTADRSSVESRLDAERERLKGVRAALGTDVAEEDRTEFTELSNIDQHPAESGTETFDRERDLGLLEQVEAELADVDAALVRLEEGTYGHCAICGVAIGEQRLEAQPAARFCLQHQAAREQGPGAGTERGPDVHGGARPI